MFNWWCCYDLFPCHLMLRLGFELMSLELHRDLGPFEGCSNIWATAPRQTTILIWLPQSLNLYELTKLFHQFDLECLNKFFDADHLVQSWQSDRNCSASALRRTFTAIDQILYWSGVQLFISLHLPTTFCYILKCFQQQWTRKKPLGVKFHLWI